ncbi:MAG: hypothetical protein Q9157_006248 [Trypethelium eluteriae]
MRSDNYSEGYSGRGGQARSPCNLTLIRDGSSSGIAGAVAADIVPIGFGSETDGSVINPVEQNAIVGIKFTVGLTSRAGVIPDSLNQDTIGKPPASGYIPFLTNRFSLQNATFGIPWETFWGLADPEQQSQLLTIISVIRPAGATIINGTEPPSRNLLVDPDGWIWMYGDTRRLPDESEYTVVKTDFYNNIRAYLAELSNTRIRTLEDIIQYNYDNDGTEGGNPWPPGIPAFYSGQDGFLASLASKGGIDETYNQALDFYHYQSRERGIDAMLANNGRPLDAVLVSPNVG